MHDIWNPWHGCKKISEGCENCYMYYLDRKRNMDGSKIFRTKEGFDYPLHRDRRGQYKIKSGERLRVCMTSDFFLEEADEWRPEAWDIMRRRSDVKFMILTKRANRIEKCLPPDWRDGWDNISLNVTAENQRRADERIPILLDIPAKHKGIMCAPFIGPVDLEKYLDGTIDEVVCGGENYDGARPCSFDWVRSLREQCVRHEVKFTFIETGTRFLKDKKLYTITDKRVQSDMAERSNMSYKGKPIVYYLYDEYGTLIPPEFLYTPLYSATCADCGSRPICNGCTYCKRCGK